MKKKRLYVDTRRAFAFSEGEGDVKKSTDVQLLRAIDAKHGLYGRVKVTSEHLNQMVQNFSANTFGQPVYFDVEHRTSAGAAGEITALRFDGTHLLADVTWTPHGVDAITNKRHELVSAEFTEEFTDSETGIEAGAVLFGAGLTTRPFVKRMQRVQLSEDGGTTIFLPDNPEEKNTMNARQRLAAKLAALKLSAAHQQSLLDKFDTAAKTLSDNAEALDATADAMIAAGTAVADASAPNNADFAEIKAEKTLSEADVASVVEKKLAEAETARTKKLTADADAETAAHKVFTDTVSEAKSLDESTRKTLSDQAGELVSAGMPEAAIKKLAETLIQSEERTLAAQKLGGMGFPAPNVAGSPRITVDHSNEVKEFTESVRTGLRQTSAFDSGAITCADDTKLSGFSKKYLALYDAQNERQLYKEARMFAEGGQSDVGDFYLPAMWQREVVRETQADLNILGLVNTVVDANKTETFSVPYSVRNDGELANSVALFERENYSRVAASTKHEIGYINKFGAMIDVSEESSWFTQHGGIDFDSWAESMQLSTQILRERTNARLGNHMLMSSDSLGAVPVAAEVVDADAYALTDPSVLKLAKFPIVMPSLQRDLTGAAVGAAKHPITLDLGGAIAPFAGAGEGPSGTYYVVLDYNLGYIRLVNQDGAAVESKPTGTIGYSYATNVSEFNTDHVNTTKSEDHWNRGIQAIGQRKARMQQDYFIQPNFLLMAHTLDDSMSNATQFIQSLSYSGSDSNAEGRLRNIKRLPVTNVAAPGVVLGESRILLGEKARTKYHVAKPLTFGQPRPVDVTDANGDVRYQGASVTHVNELSGIHTPAEYWKRLTSVLVYSAQDRAEY